MQFIPINLLHTLFYQCFNMNQNFGHSTSHLCDRISYSFRYGDFLVSSFFLHVYMYSGERGLYYAIHFIQIFYHRLSFMPIHTFCGGIDWWKYCISYFIYTRRNVIFISFHYNLYLYLGLAGLFISLFISHNKDWSG